MKTEKRRVENLTWTFRTNKCKKLILHSKFPSTNPFNIYIIQYFNERETTSACVFHTTTQEML
jgi:hypothetical protein